MISHERFEAACLHRNPGRVPIDLQIHPHALAGLLKYYDLADEAELLDWLGCDFYYLSARDISQNESCLPIYQGPPLEMSETERTCPLGICFHRDVGQAKFSVDEAFAGPLSEAENQQDVLRHEWPKPEWFDFSQLEGECEANADRVIIGGTWTGIFGDSNRMMGMERFMLLMASNPGVIKTLIDRMTEFYLQLNQRAFEQLRGRIGVWYFGNDFGSQRGLLFSRDMFLEFFAENYRKLIDLAHSYKIKVMCHSCGSIRPLIPDLIELGVDLLDPIQITAADMEPEGLKRDFGDRLVFHGGVDTQNVLTRGTPEEVQQHCQHLLDTLGVNGGYVFSSSNSIGPDTPIANIDAMYQVARDSTAKEA